MKITATFDVWDDTLNKTEVVRRLEDLLPPHGITLESVKISRPIYRRIARKGTPDARNTLSMCGSFRRVNSMEPLRGVGGVVCNKA